ncbi:glycosyltransferase [Enterococcus dongliensis]|uniref:glycosyltransferase n=1 Tax=Enterococcus dongliensis TaxID=2559925 RepID=UPI00288E4DB1|nr:glycosyltransferase [Enterococcus dongliensis]MDT2712394.1 glycosyltransferase [Enterococcus dongliensis]
MYVLMITPNKFPNGDAGAVRDEYFAKIYMELGYEVYHIGMNKDFENGNYKNIHYVSIYRDNSSILKKAINTVKYKNRVNKVYEKLVLKKGTPSIIHIYDIPSSGIEWARKEAIKYNIPIFHDSVEWYSPCEFKYGKFAYPYILKNRTNTKLIRKPFGVITISTYLEKHFKQKGLSTLRVPVIMDSRDYFPKERPVDSKVIITYAGSPAKKDYLKECIQAFEKLDPQIRSKFEFRILGVGRDFVSECCEGRAVPEEIKAYGRVPRDEVIANLEESDFSILVRPSNERYTKAGFPTKSVEAMMNGCAMICNLSSDLGMYLNDNENAIIVDDCTSEAIKKALLRIVELDHFQVSSLRRKARETAEKYFDYRLYIDPMKRFIDR